MFTSNLSRATFVVLCMFAPAAAVFGQTAVATLATLDEIRAFFKSKQKTVLTFEGYSAAGYEDEASMRKQAELTLSEFNPAKTIVNIGATPVGIGAVYELAKRKGFFTTGIVSSQARLHKVKLSRYVDRTFYVEDSTWGGFAPGTKELSPTSKAMVANSDILVAIGGGEVARDELVAGKLSGKQVRFIPADLNHRKAKLSARKKNLPEPADFRGAASTVF